MPHMKRYLGTVQEQYTLPVTGNLTSLQLNSLIHISVLSFYIINNLQSVHLPNDLHTKSIYIMSPQTKLHVQPTITSFIMVIYQMVGFYELVKKRCKWLSWSKYPNIVWWNWRETWRALFTL